MWCRKCYNLENILKILRQLEVNEEKNFFVLSRENIIQKSFNTLKMNRITALSSQGSRFLTLTLVAWGMTLGVSMLPDILFRQLTGNLPAWLYPVKVAALAVFLLASLFWSPLHPLRLFFAAMLALYSVQWGVGEGFTRLNYQSWFAGSSPFFMEMLSVQIPRFTIGVIMVLILLALTRDPKRFFFVFGQPDAVAQPIRWIIDNPTPWKKIGPIMCGCLLLGMVMITWLIGTHPALSEFVRVLPLMPFILLFAASNAFGEELSYRATLLSGLEHPLGPRQALALSALYFGLAHFYGVPYGVIGVLLSTFMGWLLGKAMLENRGFFWPWLIHVCLDVVVFSFIAIGTVTPGG
jgi:membrane protease YdiL (CAAX protease family)